MADPKLPIDPQEVDIKPHFRFTAAEPDGWVTPLCSIIWPQLTPAQALALHMNELSMDSPSEVRLGKVLWTQQCIDQSVGDLLITEDKWMKEEIVDYYSHGILGRLVRCQAERYPANEGQGRLPVFVRPQGKTLFYFDWPLCRPGTQDDLLKSGKESMPTHPLSHIQTAN